MTQTQLFTNGEPIYQPAKAQGFSYHEPFSASSRTYWTDADGEEVDREEVAKSIGVGPSDLLKWENATDSEAEGEGRADYGDW